MADNLNIEALTPLDLLMPRTYIGALLAIRTTEPISSVLPRLQHGLDGLLKQVPWLSGRVLPAASASTLWNAAALELQWSVNDPTPTILDKGSIAGSFDALSAVGMPPSAIPAEVWPAPSMIDETVFANGAPIFAASLFRFSDE
ncbi:hypothetical protein QQX98_007188 [Neonectria punicea]|uniref:Uncharacterized protein n=1 Tax=Neonectria punicea TaxID=979145 RepID=A0ABR1GYK8_9HYPO